MLNISKLKSDMLKVKHVTQNYLQLCLLVLFDSHRNSGSTNGVSLGQDNQFG